MTPRQVRKFCPLKPESMALLKAAMEDLGLCVRAHDKVLRVAEGLQTEAPRIKPNEQGSPLCASPISIMGCA
jgi:predicted ATPase with chaperone activity